MSENLKKGDAVTWKSHGRTAEGGVEKKTTSDTEEAGRTVRASKDDPQYLVGSDKSGGEALHKPTGLHKKVVATVDEVWDGSELTEGDAAHMKKVVGYVARHTAQRPDMSKDELAHT